MKTYIIRLCLAIMLLIQILCTTGDATSPLSFANDAAHFYQTPSFHGHHPTLGRNYASTLQLTYANGSAKRGMDNNANKRRILDTFGLTNLRNIVKRVSHVPPMVQTLCDALEQADSTKQVGVVGFKGKLEVDDFHLLFRQNLVNRFFIEMDIPLKKVRINQISLVDESPFIQLTNPAGQAAWEHLKNNLNTILESFALSHYDTTFGNDYHVDDMRIYGGWHTQKRGSLPFIKEVLITLRSGLILPTGPSFNTHHPFALVTGYNHHLGIPLRADISITLPHNVTLGGHAGVTFFASRHSTMRVKTDASQSGLIRLEKKRLKEQYDPAAFLGCYLLADHCIGGFSLMAGYSFTAQARRRWASMENVADASGAGWHAHTLHSALECDLYAFNYFKKRRWAPYVALFSNYQASGRNTWLTNTLGTTIGLEIKWQY